MDLFSCGVEYAGTVFVASIGDLIDHIDRIDSGVALAVGGQDDVGL